MTKVCRLCLTSLQRGAKYFNINAVESFTGFMPYRDQLTTCIPEMALDLIPNPVICNSCRDALKSSYDFKSRCMLVEKKIRDYVEKQPVDTLVYNLAAIEYSHPKPETDPESSEYFDVEIKQEITEKSETRSTSILSDLLSGRDEVAMPSNLGIEITKKCEPSLLKGEIKERILDEQKTSDDEVSLTPYEKDELGMFVCKYCDRKFPNIPSLQTHKTRMHEEDYICNFCNVPFKSLQNLRKHNQMCQKAKNFTSAPSQTVLTKRPHLPIKAKNHLKRWLFNHTDHPYPTDVEKQKLMKETNLSLLQVENWFINARRRILADLTRLKNMRGGLFRGRRLSRGRGRARGNRGSIEGNGALDDDYEMEAVDTIAAWRQFKDLESVESESSFLDFHADFEEENPLESSCTDQEIPEEELNESIIVPKIKEEGSSNEYEISVDDMNALPCGVKLEMDLMER